jgi:hypothetical protein
MIFAEVLNAARTNRFSRHCELDSIIGAIIGLDFQHSYFIARPTAREGCSLILARSVAAVRQSARFCSAATPPQIRSAQHRDTCSR